MSSRLSSLLVQDGLVSAKRVADAFQRQVIYGGTLDSNLLELKAVDEDDLINYLGRADGLPTQPTGIHAAGEPSTDVLQVFTREVAERFRAVPTALLPGGILRVLVADGVEITEMDALALEVQQRIEPWIVLEFRFVEAMERVYGVSVPSRYSRLLTRSNTVHQTKGWPAPRPIDPIPRFGSMSNLRLVPEPLPGQLSQAKFPIPAIPDAVEQTTQTTIPEQTTQMATPEQTTQTSIPEQTPPATTPEPTIQLDTPDLSIQMAVPSADAQAATTDATVQMATPEPTLQQIGRAHV